MPLQTDVEFANVEVAPTLAVVVPGTCSPDPAAITEAMTAAFQTLMGYMGRHGLFPIAPPRAIYTAYGPQGVDFSVAMPVAAPARTAPEEPPMRVETLSGGKAYRFTHHGPYRNLMQTYGQITAYLKEQGWLQSEADWAKFMPMWEEYLNDPETTPETELLTYIYLPVS